MDIFKKIKFVLSNSEKFFLDLNKEKTLEDALLFYIILLAFSAVMGYIVNIIFGEAYIKFIYNLFNLNFPLPNYNALSLISTTILGYIIGIALSFLAAGILYVWLLIFGGNKGYVKAYQLFVYSTTPKLVFGWIPIISFITGIYSLVLLIIGTKKIYNFSTTKSILIYVIPSVIIAIIALLFLVVLFAFLKTTSLSALPSIS